MIDREYLKLNTSIQTASNANNVRRDEEDNKEAVIEMNLPENLFNSSRAKKIDKVEMLPTKMRISMENTPIATVPYDPELSNLTGAVVSKCQLGVYPYILTEDNQMMPDPTKSGVFPFYKAHNMCVQIASTTAPDNEVGSVVGAFYLNSYGEFYAAYNALDNESLWKQIKQTKFGIQLEQMMNLVVPMHHEKLELSRDNKVYIRNLGTLEEMLQTALENAVTFASTGFTSEGDVTCPYGHKLVETTLGYIRQNTDLLPIDLPYTCPLCNKSFNLNNTVLYYCPSCPRNRSYIICRDCFNRQPAIVMRILVVKTTADRTRWETASPAVDWQTIIRDGWGRTYYLWKMINYTAKQPSSTIITNTLNYAFKPEVNFGDDSLTIAYDTIPFDKLIPVLGNSSFIDMHDTAFQLKFNDLLKNIWSAPPPKRAYRFGVHEDENSYSFTLLNTLKAGIMSIIANKAMKDTFSFLPWITVDEATIPDFDVVNQREKFQVNVERRTVNKLAQNQSLIPMYYPLSVEWNPLKVVMRVTQTIPYYDDEMGKYYILWCENLNSDAASTLDCGTPYPFSQWDGAKCYYNWSGTRAGHFPEGYWGEFSPNWITQQLLQAPTHTETITGSTSEIISSEISYEHLTPGTTQLTHNEEEIRNRAVNYEERADHYSGGNPPYYGVGMLYNATMASYQDLGREPPPSWELELFNTSLLSWVLLPGQDRQTMITAPTPTTHETTSTSENGWFPNRFKPIVYVSDSQMYEDGEWLKTKIYIDFTDDGMGEHVLTTFELFIAEQPLLPGITDGYYFASARKTESIGYTGVNDYQVIQSLGMEVLDVEKNVKPNLNLESSRVFYMLDATTANVEIGQSEVVYGEKQYKYDVSEKIYEKKQVGTATKEFVGDPNGTSLADGGKIITVDQATAGSYRDPPQVWPYYNYSRRKIYDHYQICYPEYIPPGYIVLEQRIGGYYAFDPHTPQDEQHPLWEDLNDIFDDEAEGSLHVFYTKLYPEDEDWTTELSQEENAYPVNPDYEPDGPFPPGNWKDGVPPGYQLISESHYKSNANLTPGESSVEEEEAPTHTIRNVYSPSHYVFFRTRVQREGEEGNYTYVGPWVQAHKYEYRDGDDEGFVYGPRQDYDWRRFVYDKEKNWTARITAWKIYAEQGNTVLDFVSEIPCRRVATSPKNLTQVYDYEKKTVKTERVVTEEPPFFDGNVRISFTWENLPMVVMSPIQSIVLTLTGVQVNQQYQPINMQQTGGSSLTTSIPVIENYSSLAQTLRDLHDELVVIKDDFCENALYILPTTSGCERNIFFRAQYITKDGSLHQIYIPPNGVFSLQLTFGLSYYTTY